MANDDEASDKIIGVAKAAGDVGLRFFLNLQSYKLDLLKPGQRKDVAMRNNMEARAALTKLTDVVDGLIPKGAKSGALARANGDIGDIVEQEMSSAARAIELATQRLQELMSAQETRRVSVLSTFRSTTPSCHPHSPSPTPSGG